MQRDRDQDRDQCGDGFVRRRPDRRRYRTLLLFGLIAFILNTFRTLAAS
jgi:hypothetical protein